MTAPQSPTQHQVSFKVPEATKALLAKLAEYERRNLGAQVGFLFEELVLPVLEERLAKYLPTDTNPSQ